MGVHRPWKPAALAVALVLALLLGVSHSGARAGDGTPPPQRPFLGNGGATAAVAAAAQTLPDGFTDQVVIPNLAFPTNLRFAPDGRIFITEKSGLLLEYDNLQDTTPTTVLDLRSQVDDYWDRGLLGLALDPSFASNGTLYLLYSYDGRTGTDAPLWNDACPSPPGPNTDGCPISGKLIRLSVGANSLPTGSPTTLIQGEWCQQFPSHSIGDLNFGPDGQLYVTGGDGASFTFADYGQAGGSSGSPTPANPCGDPPSPVGTALSPPTAEGGALRAQSVRRAAGEPVLLNGSLLRIDPATGAGSTGNPLASSTSANARRVVAYGMRNPFRFAFRPGTSEVWIGDVGWSTWEEIDRLTSVTQGPTNFGWPCYEGPVAQSGYQSANLNLCTGLYNTPGSTVGPYFWYAHSNAVASGDGCPTANGSVVSGLSFYAGSAYPSTYNGALFFGDHSRNCIWALLKGSNGLPDPANVQLVEGGASNPVDLETGPNGDIFYVDFDGGAIHRLVYGTSTTCSAGTWRAQYFNNTTMTAPAALEQCEPSLDHDWGAGSPTSSVVTNLVANGSFETNDAGWFGINGTTKAVTATGTMYGTNVLRVTTVAGAQGGVYYANGPLVNAGDAVTMGVDVSAAAGTLLVAGMDVRSSAGTFVSSGATHFTATGTRQRVVFTWPSLPAGAYKLYPFVYTDKPFAGVSLDMDGVQIEQGTVAHAYVDGTGTSGGTVNVDNFSAVWTGSFTFAAGTYTFSATADDGMRVYVDGAILIDQWKDETSATTFTASKTLTSGSHDIRVEYYEHTGNAVARVSWAPQSTNSPPTAVIDSPASTLTYAVGDTISFSGHATDPEQGALPASALVWTLVIHHCTTPTTCHTHNVQTFTGVSSGTFSAPDHDYPSYLELDLTATDAAGAEGTASVTMQPKTVDLTFASSPSGLTLAVGSASDVTPFTRTVIVNSANSVSAPGSQTLGGATYTFASWSDGGAATHNIVAPTSAATYTATYTNSATPPVNTSVPQVSGPARVGKRLTTSNGSWTGSSPITFTYSWERCAASCTTVGSGASYMIQAADRGSQLRSRVTATNGAGSASATSKLTNTVK